MPTDPIFLPDMPAVEGLTLRSITGEEDAGALYAVHTGYELPDNQVRDLELLHEKFGELP